MSQALAKPTKSDPKQSISRKIREALDVMVWQGKHYDEAARSTDLPVRSMRRALSRPEVLSYLKREREVLRASMSGRNIHRLAEIRDAANNMPAVQAIRALEEMGADTQSGSTVRLSPGITINIVSAAPANGSNAKVIDAVRDTTKLDCEPSD